MDQLPFEKWNASKCMVLQLLPPHLASSIDLQMCLMPWNVPEASSLQADFQNKLKLSNIYIALKLNINHLTCHNYKRE